MSIGSVFHNEAAAVSFFVIELLLIWKPIYSLLTTAVLQKEHLC